MLFGAPLNEKGSPAHDEVHFNFEIAFGERQILDGESIIPAITQMGKSVEEIFGLFEESVLK